jgi:5-methylcytosine-specific restriction endonuclease McrA
MEDEMQSGVMHGQTRPAEPSDLSDVQLVAEIKRLASFARATTARLLAHLAEFDARGLYRPAGFSSLFAYCTDVLRLSEAEAYNRMEGARAVRRFPILLDMVAEGTLTLTTLRLVAPHLTADNQAALLAEAANKSKREVEEMLARRFPAPDVASRIRKLSAPLCVATAASGASVGTGAQASPRSEVGATKSAGATSLPPGRRDLIRPLAPDRYEVRFTASAETCEKLKMAKDLLRHSMPNGDTAEVIDRALTALLENLARKKFGATRHPHRDQTGAPQGGRTSRAVPAQVKRAVWRRDRGQCAFLGEGGRRCGERGFLEFHHVRPHAVGGGATVENIQLRCRAHNAYEAEMYYGPGIRITEADAELVPERVGLRAARLEGA